MTTLGFVLRLLRGRVRGNARRLAGSRRRQRLHEGQLGLESVLAGQLGELCMGLGEPLRELVDVPLLEQRHLAHRVKVGLGGDVRHISSGLQKPMICNENLDMEGDGRERLTADEGTALDVEGELAGGELEGAAASRQRGAKRPCSRRFMKMQRPVPSQSRTLQAVRLRLTKRKRSPESGWCPRACFTREKRPS